MPNRVIKDSIKRSAQIDSLTWFEEVVFCRMMVTVDDYGCYDGRTVVLKNDLFPTKETVTKKAVEDAISKLVSAGLLCEYTVNGMPYLFFPTWEKHQRIRNKHRKYPEPPNDAANCWHMSADCQPESESNPNPKPNTKEGPDKPPRPRFVPPTLEEVRAYCQERGNGVDPEGFADFYTANGWKQGRGKAIVDWRAAVRTWEKREREQAGETTAYQAKQYKTVIVDGEEVDMEVTDGG